MIAEIKNSLNDYASMMYSYAVETFPKLVISLIILTILWLITVLIKRVFRSRVYGRLSDPLMMKFVVGVIRWTILGVGILVCLKILGLGNVAIGLFSGAGVAALVLGFAFKDIGENFIAGILMAFNRPFKQGDLIQLGDQKGRVHTMGLRETVIKTYDGKDVFIPNANILKSNLINDTVDGLLRYEINLGLDYGTDLDKAFAIILDTVKSIDGVLKIPEPKVYVDSFGESTINIQYTLWVDLFDNSLDRLSIKSQAYYKVWENLTESSIAMPGKIIELKSYTEDLPINIKSNNK